MKNKVIVVAILFIFNITYFGTSIASAKITFGGIGINNYDARGCSFGARAGKNYVDNFSSAITSIQYDGISYAEKKFIYSNEGAWESDLLTASYTNIEDVEFCIFAGHGLAYNKHGVSSNTLHLYTLNSSSNFHPSGVHYSDYANVETLEAWWGNNGVTKWVQTYSCNFLNSTDPNWKSIMGGVHQVLGYGSTMYLDSREGSLFGKSLRDGWNIIDAYFNANRMYQPNGGFSVTSRVLYANISEGDTIRSYSRKPAMIQQNTDTYSYRTITIQ